MAPPSFLLHGDYLSSLLASLVGSTSWKDNCRMSIATWISSVGLDTHILYPKIPLKEEPHLFGLKPCHEYSISPLAVVHWQCPKLVFIFQRRRLISRSTARSLAAPTRVAVSMGLPSLLLPWPQRCCIWFSPSHALLSSVPFFPSFFHCCENLPSLAPTETLFFSAAATARRRWRNLQSVLRTRPSPTHAVNPRAATVAIQR